MIPYCVCNCLLKVVVFLDGCKNNLYSQEQIYGALFRQPHREIVAIVPSTVSESFSLWQMVQNLQRFYSMRMISLLRQALDRANRQSGQPSIVRQSTRQSADPKCHVLSKGNWL